MLQCSVWSIGVGIEADDDVEVDNFWLWNHHRDIAWVARTNELDLLGPHAFLSLKYPSSLLLISFRVYKSERGLDWSSHDEEVIDRRQDKIPGLEAQVLIVDLDDKLLAVDHVNSHAVIVILQGVRLAQIKDLGSPAV